MSTSAIIARATTDGWAGRYHHWEGFPSRLGASLWAHLHGHFRGDLAAMLAYILDAPHAVAGWSSLVDADLNLAPVAHWKVLRRADDAPRPPVAYALGGEKPDLYTPKRDLVGISMLYVFDERARTLQLFRVRNGLSFDMARIPLDGSPPNWNDLDQRAFSMAERDGRDGYQQVGGRQDRSDL